MFSFNNKKRLTKESQIEELTPQGPVVLPLSPCVIKPYNIVNGIKEENKGYIPVFLLKNALDDDRMLNIAVAGNYGVGKSSIIKTVEEEICDKHKFINISLASLLVSEHKAAEEEKNKKKIINKNESEIDSNTVSDKVKGTVDDKGQKNKEDKPSLDYDGATIQNTIYNKQIEYSILQQIIYHDRPQKTPKSKVKRVYKTKKNKPFLVSLYSFLMMMALSILLNPEWANLSRLFGDLKSDVLERCLLWIAIVVIFAGVIIACCYIGKRFNFSVIRFGNKNIEMSVERDQSIFNIYMDEIIYFFECTDYDVVVFEDLDRFESREVLFYKLRELNTILNNSQCLNRRINFVYAVLDDLFDATERVKFFDVIITVIPVVNSLNSCEKLKELITPIELFNSLGKKELYNLCDYLQDMRLLMNIVNEFNQFAPLIDSEMSDSEMTMKKLFGLIVYKNYVPSDFSLMYNKRGVVATAIENASSYKQEIVAEKQKTIEQLQMEIKKTKDKYVEDIVKLRKQILDLGKSLLGYSTNYTNLRIGDAIYTFDRVAQKQSLFDSFRRGEAFYTSSGSNVRTPSFETIENNMTGGRYDEQVRFYKTETDNAVNDLENQIKNLELELKSMPSTIHEIYQMNTTYLDSELKPLKNADKINLVKFLILNGYFDLYYQNYISHFYPNSLTREDLYFVMHAARYEGVGYEAKLSNVDEILKRFDPDDFAVNDALLNLYIVRVVFGSNDFSVFRSPICQGIKRTRNLDFILIAYRSDISVPDDFFNELLSSYDYWEEISHRKEDEKDDLREIYYRYCDIRIARSNTKFCDWISNNYSFLNKRWGVISTDRLTKVLFKECKPRFKKLNFKTAPFAIIGDIYENGRFVFNETNVREIANSQEVMTDYSISSYGTICKLNNEALLKMVKSNWSASIREVFPKTSVFEDEATQVAMINDLSIPENDLRYYLSRQRNRIKHADKLNDIRLSFAYDNSLVEASWNNVYYYAITKGKGLPLALMEKNTFKSLLMSSLSMEKERALSNLVVFSDEISMPKYKELVPLFGVKFSSIPNEIHRSRIKYLVDKNYLEFNEANFDTIKQYGYSDAFLAKNVAEFIKAPEKYSIDSLDAVAALKGAISNSTKCEFIRQIKSKNLAPIMDLISLIRPFLISGDISARDISPRLLVGIVTKAQDNDKVILGRKAILSSVLNEEETKEVLSAMGGDYKKLVNKSSKTSSISYSTNNMKIVNHLVRIGLLKGVTRVGNSIVVEKMV